MTRPGAPMHAVVVGLGFGDEGKGSTVDFLCRTRPVRSVIRFNGGAQALHHVVDPSRGVHGFSQFGSGTLAGVPTYLSRFVLVDPFRMSAEAVHLQEMGVPDPMSLMSVDRWALLITPYHREANRQRELRRGDGRHGSCGVGIGETASYALDHPLSAPHVGDCADKPGRLRSKLNQLREWFWDEFRLEPEIDNEMLLEGYRQFAGDVTITERDYYRELLQSGTCVFEGAQGVLLDEWRGFHPYTTWSTTTPHNALALVRDAGSEAAVLGVLRTTTTRHGPGPLPTEDGTLSEAHVEPHNFTGKWQGAFRVGHFDAVATRYAIEVSGQVDAISLTHLDTVGNDFQICHSYRIGERIVHRLPVGELGDLGHQERLTSDLLRARPAVVESADRWRDIQDAIGVPVSLLSHGPTWKDKTGVLQATPS